MDDQRAAADGVDRALKEHLLMSDNVKYDWVKEGV
jgi:hypothetical protein